MANDPFEDLLDLEDSFYKEGYDAGVADAAYAGMIEGKVFGVEKGYEKALELARLHGRALVWKARTEISSQQPATASESNTSMQTPLIESMKPHMEGMPSSTRTRKHIDTLLTLTNGAFLKTDNSDESVTEFDEIVAKARAKAKIIAKFAGETLAPANMANGGIEDATGLNARS